jgi:CRP-like cAMP-binding protein
MSGSRAGSEAYEFLSRVPVFSRLGARSLRKLVRLCIERTYDAGSSIITEGSTGLGLFVITSGSVEVFKRDGSDRVVLARLDRGAVLGELALIDAQPRSASAVALTDTTCLLIARSGFQDLVRREPDIAWCFVPVLAARMRDLQAQVMAARDHAPGPDADRRKARSEEPGTETVEPPPETDQAESG